MPPKKTPKKTPPAPGGTKFCSKATVYARVPASAKSASASCAGKTIYARNAGSGAK